MRRNVLAGSLVVIAMTAAVALAMAEGYRASASEASAAARAAPARTYDANTVQARFAQAQSVPPAPSRHESQWSAVSPADAERAAAAALKATGGGTVHDVDRDVEGGATWEVEITTTDGRAVDVLLDAQLNVLSTGGESDDGEFGQQGGHSRDDDDDRDEDRDDD